MPRDATDLAQVSMLNVQLFNPITLMNPRARVRLTYTFIYSVFQYGVVRFETRSVRLRIDVKTHLIHYRFSRECVVCLVMVVVYVISIIGPGIVEVVTFVSLASTALYKRHLLIYNSMFAL